jgi:hypothetical protein
MTFRLCTEIINKCIESKQNICVRGITMQRLDDTRERFLTMMPEEIKNKIRVTCNRIEFLNGSTIRFIHEENKEALKGIEFSFFYLE